MALHRLVEINYHLGLEDEAKNYAKILGYNYNTSQWFEQTYKILNKNYKNRLGKLLVNASKLNKPIQQKPNKLDVMITSGKVIFMETKRAEQIKQAFKKHPTKIQFMAYMIKNPFVWMATRIKV